MSWVTLLQELNLPVHYFGYMWSAMGIIGIFAPLISLKLMKQSKEKKFILIAILLTALSTSMIIFAKTKFDWHIDPIQLGKTFMQITNLHDVPKMLVPFDRKEMESFFLSLASDLKKDIFH